MHMNTSHAYYSFPAVRGIQAGREYYTIMLPLRLVPKLFLFDSEELDPKLRSQRRLNKGRVPAIARYMIQHPNDYVFSSLAVSVDAVIQFMPVSDDPALYNIGSIRIPPNARFVINDGQHRRAAIELAIEHNPRLADETISCVVFQDRGLKRSQQMFSDLNRYAVKPSRSVTVLYDDRDMMARIAKALVERVPIFCGSTELERSTISNRSTKLFTLSAIHRATVELLRDFYGSEEEELEVSSSYWTELSKSIVPWRDAKAGRIRADVLRRDYIVGHAVALVAFGRVGRALLTDCPTDWRGRLALFYSVDWSRRNQAQWEGRVTHAGRVSIAANHIALLSNELKRILGLSLTPEEQYLEQAWATANAAQERSMA